MVDEGFVDACPFPPELHPSSRNWEAVPVDGRVVKRSPKITASLAIILLAITIYGVFLTYYISNTPRETSSYVIGPVKVTGLIVEQQFPVRKYVSLEAAKGDPIFQKDSVLGIEFFDCERPIPYALFNSALEGTIYESVYPYLNLSGIVGGLSRADVFNAYVSRSRVVVEGVAFVVNRNGVDCPCIDVSRIEILDQ